MLRVLHTSDWHLGHRLHGLSRELEHRAFLDWLLDLLEAFHLKLPEGPHRFLTTRELAALADCGFRTLEHRLFLAFPAGPDAFVRAVDRAVAGRHGRGLFQYILLERQGDPAP